MEIEENMENRKPEKGNGNRKNIGKWKTMKELEKGRQ